MKKKNEEVITVAANSAAEMTVEETVAAEMAGDGKKKGRKKVTPVENFPDMVDSGIETFRIDVRRITTSHNHRYIFTDKMLQEGYGLFEPLPEHPDLPPLWKLATSEDLAERAEFRRIMELYEESNPADPTILDLATSIHSNPKGQLHPIYVRDNGVKKDGKRSFQLVAGHRRSVAILWLWCTGLLKQPTIWARLVKGNNLDLTAVQDDENQHRKKITPIIIAKGYQRALNAGATLSQIAESHNMSEQTVTRYLDFLELEPKEQDKLNSGMLSQNDAIAIVKSRRKGGDGVTADGLTADEAVAKRPAKGGKRHRVAGKKSTKQLETLYEQPPTDWKNLTPGQVKFCVGIILGKHDKNGVPIKPGDANNDLEAVLPPEGTHVGLMDDDYGDLEVDEHGNVI